MPSFIPTFINGEQIQSSIFRAVHRGVQLVQLRLNPPSAKDSPEYLGMVLDCNLRWGLWVDCIITKAQQSLYFLKKLVSFHVNSKILVMFYFAFIESILVFCSICFYGYTTEAQKKCLRKIVTIASKLLGTTMPSLEQIYRDIVAKKAGSIVADLKHPLSSSFDILPSVQRYCLPLVSKNRTKFSFMPQAIRLLNSSEKQ